MKTRGQRAPAAASETGLNGMDCINRIRPVLIFPLLVIASLIPEASLAGERDDISFACGEGGIVSTACPQATAVGLMVLESGGNAVDAAVATGFALAVTYPAAGNIGGGGFLLVRLESGETSFIDFREKAPGRAKRDMYLDDGGEVIEGLSTLGHKSSGVPGSVAGLYEAWRAYGTIGWRELIEPSIKLAEEGFEISAHLAVSLARLEEYLDGYPALEKFMKPGGKPLAEGDRLVQPDLARTLRAISEAGPEPFYRGYIARLIEEEMKNGGGLVTGEDLEKYEVMIREPVSGTYRGYDVISAPPPSSGGIVLLEILNILEGYDIGRSGFMTDRTAHLMIEAEKRAYHDRAVWLGDPGFVEIPVSMLISKEYAGELRSSIGEEATPSAGLSVTGESGGESEETTHYSILDGKGNAVAVTTTLNSAFGSKVVVRGAGFLMNNEMDDFSVKPGVPNIYGLTGGKANSIEPGKRMLSSMTPTIVLSEGRVRLVTGTPGGSTIITTIAQILIDSIDFGMDGVEAVEARRFHHQWTPDVVYCEKGAFPDEVARALEARGHRIKERLPIGDVQLITVENEMVCGVSDPRAGGRSLGTGKGFNRP